MTMSTAPVVDTKTISDMKVIKSQNNSLARNNQLTRRTIPQIMIMARDRFQLLSVHINLLRALEELEMKASMDRVLKTQA
jgi:hypothetical protein